MNEDIKINKERAREICQVVLDAYENKEGLFANPNIKDKMLPEKQLVSVIPKKRQGLWLFFSCLGDKMVNSPNYYKQFKQFYLNYPDFFDLKNLKNNFHIKLEEKLIPEVKVAIPKEFIRFTVSNAKKLVSDFNGNPLNVLKNNSFKESIENLKKFLGFGDEIAALYNIFLARYSIRKTEGLIPKIDRHFLRISVGCNVVDIKNGIRTDKVIRELSKAYKKICDRQGFDVILLDPIAWIIGHELCLRQDRYYCKSLCPLDYYCSENLPKINRKDARLYKSKHNKRDQYVLPFKTNIKL